MTLAPSDRLMRSYDMREWAEEHAAYRAAVRALTVQHLERARRVGGMYAHWPETMDERIAEAAENAEAEAAACVRAVLVDDFAEAVE